MLMPRFRNVLLVPFLMAVILSFTVSYCLRFDFSLPTPELLLIGIAIVAPIKSAFFWLFRLQSMRWRHVGMFELNRIWLANLCASAVVALVLAGITHHRFPRSVYVIDAAVCFLATAALPFGVRTYWELIAPAHQSINLRKRVLIYGAGVAGVMLAKEIRSNSKLGMSVVGFIDDDPAKQNSQILGIPILGTGRDGLTIIKRFAKTRHPLAEVIIAMPSATGRRMRTVIANCRAMQIPFKTLPGTDELLSGMMSRQIREVSPNDLLGREPAQIDENRIREALRGEVVLVTGGCGSIGSELCRQVASYGPAKLVIFDQAESEMFMLAMELRSRHPDLNLVTEIGDIVRPSRVDETMAKHKVNVVFHAAAYKHVPLMEENIAEAVENNVLGTYNVANAAYKQHVKHFVLISTDKAVNPTSIMGMTKRIAEKIVAGIPLDGSRKHGTFVSVRFGNVLGSAGSVIPVFRRQIANGGPVTVTHPDMRRYFMSISEAVQLVLQASIIGEGREVFFLDMGEPVSIVDLAHNMIRMAGYEPNEDIEVRFTGLRPGEKLIEELHLQSDDVLPTIHSKIRKFRSREEDSQVLLRWLESLRMLLMVRDPEGLRTHLERMVPEHQAGRTATVLTQPSSDRVMARV